MDKGIAAAALLVGLIVGIGAAGVMGFGAKTVTQTVYQTVTQTNERTVTVTETVTTTVTQAAEEALSAKFQEELQRECTACHAVPEGVKPVMPEERKTVQYSGTVLLANDKLAVLKTPDGKIIHVVRAPRLCSLQPGDKIAGEGTEMMVKPSVGWMLVKAETCTKQS